MAVELTVTTTLRTMPEFFGGKKLLSKIANRIFDRPYRLSVVFVGDDKSQTLNRIYRKKDTPTNVLAFPYDRSGGEIFINVPRALREANTFAHTPHKHIVYLFIHGALHLKGHTHGRTMDKAEEKLVQRFLSS